jgi:hypothetical protein
MQHSQTACYRSFLSSSSSIFSFWLMSAFAFRRRKMVVLYSLANGLVIDPATEDALK